MRQTHDKSFILHQITLMMAIKHCIPGIFIIAFDIFYYSTLLGTITRLSLQDVNNQLSLYRKGNKVSSLDLMLCRSMFYHTKRGNN